MGTIAMPFWRFHNAGKEKEEKKGSPGNIQRGERGTARSFSIHRPAALAETARITKNEEGQWSIENRHESIFKRNTPLKSLRLKNP